MSWRVRLLGLAGAVAFGCTSGPTAPSSASAACTPHPASANAVLPVFGRPFDGAFPIGNFFDHDKPIEGDANGYVLTLCGARDTSQVDGHPGYDWRMPEGTPLLAVADAVVMTAGLEAPNLCPQLNRTVQALLVVLVHTAPTGELYASIYGHLSRIDVQAGVRQRRRGDRAVRQHRLQRHTASALRRRAERRRPLCPDRSLRVARSDGGSV